MNRLTFLPLFLCLLLSGCGTTDGALQEQGKSASYITGFHDGRHSGMSEQGNEFEHYIKDEDRFAADTDYRQGWVEGEVEGKTIQRQAASVGEAIGGTYKGQVNKEIEKNQDIDAIAKDAVKGVDTAGFDSLGK